MTGWSHTRNLWWGKKREAERFSRVLSVSPDLSPVPCRGLLVRAR